MATCVQCGKDFYRWSGRTVTCAVCRSKMQSVYDKRNREKHLEHVRALGRATQKRYRIRHGLKLREAKPPPPPDCKSCAHRDVLFCKHPALPAFLRKDGARFIASHGHCPLTQNNA